MERDADVIVVGAGFTGLAAAQTLMDRGLSVIVLEARADVGGRVRSFETPDGTRRDAGGQFICDDMPEVMTLVREARLEMVESRWKGAAKTVSATPSRRASHRDNPLSARMEAADPADPALAGLSIADWLDEQDATEEAKREFLSMVHGLWCLPADIIPFWYLVDSDRRNTADVSELQYFLKDSAASLADALAARLRPHVFLSTPVSAIHRDEHHVIVETVRRQLTARHVLVAVPPVRARDIIHHPPLPEPLVRALGCWRSGAVIKILLRYDERFWSPEVSSGVSWEDVSGLYAFDVSQGDAHAAFVVFVGGPLALEWQARGAAFIERTVRERMGALLGDNAPEPVDVILHDWTDDRWSGGGYSDVIVDAEAYDAEALLRRGVDRVAFASSELSPSFPTYIEGAIVAGRLAAGRISDAVNAEDEAPGAGLKRVR
ncbi:flavin monoamine oxidase family protein [Rhizobium sp. 9140]|uniref:flavin monoamine oxidase family protein n=1 Tax=Rhizobium sp. 9140 TaxID=1761900 RepID=UPI00079C27E5|nr:FAD-dependent oxidoreductase [Rhizobium sp. 9140]CZT35677.1 monoamine oxidase [Rhizobium sp. 9140]